MAGKRVKNSLLEADDTFTFKTTITIIESTKPERVELHDGVYHIFKHDHSKH